MKEFKLAGSALLLVMSLSACGTRDYGPSSAPDTSPASTTKVNETAPGQTKTVDRVTPAPSAQPSAGSPSGAALPSETLTKPLGEMAREAYRQSSQGTNAASTAQEGAGSSEASGSRMPRVRDLIGTNYLGSLNWLSPAGAQALFGDPSSSSSQSGGYGKGSLILTGAYTSLSHLLWYRLARPYGTQAGRNLWAVTKSRLSPWFTTDMGTADGHSADSTAHDDARTGADHGGAHASHAHGSHAHHQGALGWLFKMAGKGIKYATMPACLTTLSYLGAVATLNHFSPSAAISGLEAPSSLPTDAGLPWNPQNFMPSTPGAGLPFGGQNSFPLDGSGAGGLERFAPISPDQGENLETPRQPEFSPTPLPDPYGAETNSTPEFIENDSGRTNQPPASLRLPSVSNEVTVTPRGIRPAWWELPWGLDPF